MHIDWVEYTGPLQPAGWQSALVLQYTQPWLVLQSPRVLAQSVPVRELQVPVPLQFAAGR
jgi:hypothetical protein